jgi:hypothetical protein
MLYYSMVEYIEQSPKIFNSVYNMFLINVNGEFFPNFIKPTKGGSAPLTVPSASRGVSFSPFLGNRRSFASFKMIAEEKKHPLSLAGHGEGLY